MQLLLALAPPLRTFAFGQTRALLPLVGRVRTLHTAGSSPANLAATSTSTSAPSSPPSPEPLAEPSSSTLKASSTPAAAPTDTAVDPSTPAAAPRKLTWAEQDALVRERLLERDGGGLGVPQGEWNGLARNVKDNMVRLCLEATACLTPTRLTPVLAPAVSSDLAASVTVACSLCIIKLVPASIPFLFLAADVHPHVSTRLDILMLYKASLLDADRVKTAMIQVRVQAVDTERREVGRGAGTGNRLEERKVV